MKRVLALCLTAAMLIGMLPAMTLFTRAEEAVSPAYQAAYAASVAVDGSLAETQWLTDGKMTGDNGGKSFGALWNKECLYLAAVPSGSDTTWSVTVNEADFSVTAGGVTKAGAAVDGAAVSWQESAVEVQIPLSAFGLTLYDYSQTVPMKLNLGGAQWEGELCFNSLVRSDFQPTMVYGKQVEWSTSTSEALGAEAVTDGYHFFHQYLENGTNVSTARAFARSFAITPFADRSETLTFEFDFVVDAMPAYKLAALTGSFLCYGFNIVLADAEYNGLVTGITNTEDGLYFLTRGSGSPSYSTLKLNKALGEKFHIRMDWTTEGTLRLYVDGALVQEFANAEMDKALMESHAWTQKTMLHLNMWSDTKIPESEADEIDITMTNLTFGQTPFDTALDNLSFDAIKGGNANDRTVIGDLALLSSWSNGQLETGEIVWTSSKTEVIANDGKVTPADTNEAVTMTAAMKDFPSITQDILVNVRAKFMDAVFTNESLTVDGALDEVSWIYANYKNLATTSGNAAPVGRVAALMKEGVAYLAVPCSGADSLYIKLGDQEWTLDLTQASFTDTGVRASIGTEAVEMSIDLAALDMQLLDYNLEQLKFQVVLSKDGSTAALDTVPIWLIFVDSKVKDSLLEQAVQGTKQPIDLNSGAGVNAAMADYTVTFDATSATYANYQGWRRYNYSIIDHTKDIELSADLTVEKMPGGAASGTYDGAGSYNGLTAWLCDAEANCYIKATIFHNGDGNLKLVIPANDQQTAASAPVDLGVTVGSSFALKLKWTTDDKLVVYVDGEEKGSLEAASLSGTWGVGDAVAMRYVEPACTENSPAKIQVAGLTIMVGDATKAIVDLTDANFKLNGSAKGKYTTVEMSADDTTEADYIITFEQTSATYGNYRGWRRYNYSIIDHTKDIELSADLTVEKMPGGAVSGTYDGAGSYNGLTAWLCDAEANCYIKATIFHNGDGNLKLVIPANDQETAASAPVDLGVTVGSSFVLKLKWTTDDKLVVYVDGEEKGSLEAASLSGTWGVGDAVAMRYVDPACTETSPVKIQIGGPTIKVGDTAEAIADPTNSNFSRNNGSAGAYAPLASWVIEDVTQITHNRNMLLEQVVEILKMEGTSGSYQTILEDAAAGKYLYAKVYADAENKLYLTDKAAVSAIALGKTVGQKFTLGLKWGTDESVTVYVDGTVVGTIENASCTGSVCGKNAITLRYEDQNCVAMQIKLHTMELTLESLTAENGLEPVEPLEEELTVDAVLPGVALDALVSNIILPETAHSKYLGTLPLKWATNDKALTDTGAVTRPEGRVGRYVDVTMSVDGGRKLWVVEAYVMPLDSSAPSSPDHLNAPFTAETPTIDGSAADEGWNLNIQVADTGRFGVQWDMEKLYLAAETGGAVLKVTLNGEQIDLTGAAIGTVTEIAVSLADIGIAVKDYAAQFDAKVEMGEAVWEGTITLSSNDWFITDGDGETRIPVFVSSTSSGGTDAATENQGVESVENGYHYYDLYDRDGSNPTNIRSSVVFGNANGDDVFAAYNDMTAANYVEFDFCAKNMPVYSMGEAAGWDYLYACYGFMWYLTRAEDAGRQADTASMGIFNSAKGLVFVVNGAEPKTYELGKQIGDQFRVGTRMETDNSLTLFVDGVRIANFSNVVKKQMGTGSNILRMLIYRSGTAAASKNDNIDIYVTNIAMGKSYGDTLLDSLTFDTIKGENTNQHGVDKDLELAETLTNPQFTTGPSIEWSSSDPAVIDPDTGKVTQPENGKLVTLTATADGKTKQIQVYVKGTSGKLDVLIVENDLGTATGVGKAEDVYQFTLDATNNSIVYDLHSVQKVNVIALKDSDETNRLNESVLTIWTSNDNKTYTMVDSFKILRDGEMTYLYDFSAEAQYIKVHCTHFDGTEASFTAPLSTMIEAYYEEHFGAEGTFESTRAVTVTNADDFIHYDDAWTISKDAAGVVGTDASIRVYLGEELLYHYVDGDNIVVRIPEIAAKGSVELTVLSGNAKAMDISNKEYVYEVVYGTREAYNGDENGAVRWVCTLKDGVMFGCTTVDAGNDNSMTNNHVVYSYSYDGGMTWTRYKAIECTVATGGEGYIVACGGVVYDPSYGENGRIVVQGISNPVSSADHTLADCKVRFVYSDDLGKTWKRSEDMVIIPTEQDTGHYTLSYADPVILSTNDGDGPAIDYLLPCHTKYDDNGGYCSRIAYTTDAGVTWTLGEDEIILEAEGAYTKEVGVSEGTILEREDGVLVLYTRCQFADVYNFARSFSYDGGLNWVETAELGNNYTVNTQPIMHQFGDTALLTWAGNNVLGGNSYARFPLNVAYSTDGLITFENIQNLYSRYSLQGMTLATGGMATNQTLDFVGDTMTIAWGHDTFTAFMNVKNFTDYFFRTKGAYDSFENTNPKYEGWSTTSGMVVASDAQKTEGEYSMLIAGGSSAVRSIPYLQDGTVEFDLYLDSLDAVLQIELEAAYGTEYGKAAPIAFEVSNGVVTFLGADGSSGVTLQQGWNRIVFQLNLSAETPSATMSANGAAAVTVPVNAEVGDYVCYVDVSNIGVENCYLDAFKVVDTMPVEVPDQPHDLEEVKAAEATCTEDGNIAYWICTECGKLFADAEGKKELTLADTVVKAAGHGLVQVPAKASTALESGNLEYYLCEHCQMAFWDADGKRVIQDMSAVVVPKLIEDTIPETGDQVQMELAVVLLLTGFAGACLLTWDRKRRMN